MSRYALIKDDVVVNIIIANPHNATKIACEQEAIAVNADAFSIEIGDTFIEQAFRLPRDILDADENVIAKAGDIRPRDPQIHDLLLIINKISGRLKVVEDAQKISPVA